jgi:acyl carrier protein
MNIDLEIKKIFKKKIHKSITLKSTKKNSEKNWDSLKHIELILYLQDFFNIKFTNKEIEKFNSVKYIISLVKKKLQK